MKQTQRVDAVRNIRKRIVSYLSICLIVMLGTGGFFTTRYMYRGFMKDAKDIYDDRSFEIIWGDCGVANFFINSEALLKKDFSKVIYNWDCY